MAASAEATTHAEVGQEAGHANFPPFDTSTFPSQILWFALVFGAMYFYLSRHFLPAVGGVIEARRARIAKDIDEATAMQTKADEAAAAHEKSLAQARLNAQATAQAARDKIAAETDAKRKALEDQLAGKMAEAEGRIAANRNAAMANVAGIAKEATGAIVERLIGRAPDQAAVAAAVDSSSRA
ncbi:MAG: ATP F0F1 synthase subunit B [Pseudomonadota bacterium]|nr:ATP F0F1 synthase subunit B [Pseudomonadota bacterium]